MDQEECPCTPFPLPAPRPLGLWTIVPSMPTAQGLQGDRGPCSARSWDVRLRRHCWRVPAGLGLSCGWSPTQGSRATRRGWGSWGRCRCLPLWLRGSRCPEPILEAFHEGAQPASNDPSPGHIWASFVLRGRAVSRSQNWTGTGHVGRPALAPYTGLTGQGFLSIWE